MRESPWFENLNDRQLEAVAYQPRPLVVLAGPGSGKTRILINRIAWLIREQNARPGNILAVTFTNRAAEEMRDRLGKLLGDEANKVWVYTFHAAAVRILRRFGTRIDIAPNFAILDEDDQRHVLNQILRQAGLSRELYPVSQITDLISQRKNLLQDPISSEDTDTTGAATIIEAYQAWLREHNTLDFDDLIRHAVVLVRNDPETRSHFHRTLAHILVDEYQDINLAQFELLKLLAPVNSSVTIVADDDQSIYGWRGAKPELIDDFIQRYSPHIVKLDTSYRCPDTILYGAQRLIVHQRSQERQRFMRSQVEGGPPIFHYIFDDVRQEQRWLVALIDKLIKERNHKPGDIAVLYRTHRLAEPAEQALIQAGFKVHRLHKESFFDEPVTRDVVRYLQLAQAINEETFAAALNFPLRLVDELTMVQLRRLAETQGISLIDLTRRIDDYSEVSPLTRAHLQRFLNLLEQRFPQLTVPAESAVRALFDMLDEQRSPWRMPDRILLEGFMRFTDFSAEADELATAIETDRPIIFVHPPTLDGAAAATILRLTLSDYLGVSATSYSDVEIAAVDLPPNAFVVLLGNVDLPHGSPPHPHIRLPRPAAEHPYALATLAWRCAQLLLVGYETLADSRYVIYDIETTGTNVRRDEIVEIAAATYEDQQAVGEPFHRFVRPQRNYIPHAATNVHGIRYEDVADAPTIPQVLPEFLDYVGAETLVGHNIARFDNRFIDRACGEQWMDRDFTRFMSIRSAWVAACCQEHNTAWNKRSRRWP